MATADEVTADLNPEQRRAVQAVRGPVVILAGAGSGKTTTITRRIANQVLEQAFAPQEILAVTFTRRAAEEMKHRLAALGVSGVPASTFHSAAQRQIAHFANERRPVVSNKFALLYPLLNALPPELRKIAAGDVAAEIEWARNGRLTPDSYVSNLAGHEPPLPAGQMAKVFRDYEQAKRAANVIDFEDQLELAVRIFEADENATERFRDRYRAFTVDEFQDVNLLQWTLLSLWLGDSDELCAVGDDHQSIYGFTGATPRYLLQLPAVYPNATVVQLEQNYRSTRQVVTFANRLSPHLGGRKKVLRAEPDGAEPEVRIFKDYEQEAAAIAGRCAELHRAGTPLSELAILYRGNYRSPVFEEALLAVHLPFVVYGGSFLERHAAKQLLPRLRSQSGAADVEAVVAREAVAAGYVEEALSSQGPAEQTRQADLARFVVLGEAYAGSDETVGGFLKELERRFGAEVGRDAVQLLTYHSAKGLEWEAVFLPRVEEGELPHWRATKQGFEAEERRLLYVGITRAKRHLWLSHTREGSPSPFLDELSGAPSARPAARPSSAARRPAGHRTGSITGKPAKHEGGWVPDWMRNRPAKG